MNTAFINCFSLIRKPQGRVGESHAISGIWFLCQFDYSV
jgi:hypothetical protein